MSRISIKIIFTIVLCVLIVSTFIGLFSQNIASRIISDEASEKFYNISRSYANEFSLLFCTISSTTDTLALNIGSDLDIDAFVADSDYRDHMMQKADKKIKTLGEQASDIQGIYVVFDPELTNQVYESWFIDDGQGNFVYQTPEDISLFYPDNEDMAWYYDPIRAGQGVWSEPYTDATINIEMISYTTPIWIDNQIIGVAGIDISFESILETMENMTFYDAGYPFLIDQDYNIISHPELDNGTSLYDIENGNLRVITDSLDSSTSGIVSYTYKNTDMMLGYSRLTNGWYFLASTELQEIQSPLQELTKMIFLVSSVIALIALMIGLKLSSNITKPLNQLIQYTNQISTGNYNIDHKENRNDEIGLLLNSFKQMSQEIHSSQTELEALSNDMTYQAYHDTLTRLANRRFAQKQLHELIDTYSETLDITGLMIIDLNDFKSINDTYGHNAGDQVLIHATEMMLHCISDKDELFRFGGDEFLLIYKELPSLEHIEKLTMRLLSSIKRPLQIQSKLVQVSASIGVTIIHQDNLDYDTILAQADIAMYEAKKSSSGHKFFTEP